jgi:hypothetical protein
MTMKLRMLAAALIALSTIGVGLRQVQAAPVDVPFDGNYAGAITLTDNYYVRLFDGTGTSTHLGRSANHGEILITGLDDSCSGGVANVNVETLTAANGDLLVLTNYDVACPIGPNLYHGTGNWIVAGGTGRFSGATGHGTFEGQADFNQLVFTFHLSGVISAPNGG